jgi:glucose/arabinose dehydrogenase
MKKGFSLMRPLNIPKDFLFFKVVTVVFLVNLLHASYVSGYTPFLRFSSDKSTPVIHDPNLRIEEVTRGLDLPTSMAFLGMDEMLALENNKGTIQRIVNGQIMDEPLIDVNVSTDVERCMCGIAVSMGNNTANIFLYYTESEVSDGGEALGNRVYRYDLSNDELVNGRLLLDLPAQPGPRHNGGAIRLGLDNNSLYVPIGDVDGSFNPDGRYIRTQTQNYINSSTVDGRSGILAIGVDGRSLVDKGLLGDDYPLVLYYAYGIRNSFGIDFDPLTGNLWDTENGPAYADEINLVKPGFNSGYTPVHGIWAEGVNPRSDVSTWELFLNSTGGLVDFDGRGKYSFPEFTWIDPVGVTAIKFFPSEN